MFPILHTHIWHFGTGLCTLQSSGQRKPSREHGKWLRRGKRSGRSSCVFCGMLGGEGNGLLSPLRVPQEVAGIQTAVKPLHCCLS